MGRQADRSIVVITLLLLLFGLIMVYSASTTFSLKHFNNSFYLLIKQSITAAIGVGCMFIFARFDYHRFSHLDDVLLIGSFLLTILTVLPLRGLGGGRWLTLGPFAIQPTELVKFSLIIYLASAISRKKRKITSFAEGVLPFLVVLALLAIVVMKQPDLGMMLIYGLLVTVMLFLGGARVSHLLMVAAGSLPLVYLALLFAPYRMARILSFLDPFAYRSSSGYQIIQSLIAIGSGGVIGRGLGESQTKLFYLPQAHNDFIFSITAEELGLVGALILILMLAIFCWRAFCIASWAPDKFGQLLAYGIGFTIFLQAFVNIGVTVGILPVTGLTLPFISSGGSSLVITLAMVGVLLNVSSQGEPL